MWLSDHRLNRPNCQINICILLIFTFLVHKSGRRVCEVKFDFYSIT